MTGAERYSVHWIAVDIPKGDRGWGREAFENRPKARVDSAEGFGG